jgi:hypothetical protein
MADTVSDSVFQQNKTVEEAPLQQDILLFEPQSNRFCMLNRTSAFIWGCMKAPVSTEEIARQLSFSFAGVSYEDALRDVLSTMSTFQSLNLVTAGSPE